MNYDQEIEKLSHPENFEKSRDDGEENNSDE